MCACVCVCFGGLVISVLCQLMRDEKGHLFRGAGWRAAGQDLGMGDVSGFSDGTAAGCRVDMHAGGGMCVLAPVAAVWVCVHLLFGCT